MVCHVFYCPVLVLLWLFELPVVTTVFVVVLLGAVQSNHRSIQVNP